MMTTLAPDLTAAIAVDVVVFVFEPDDRPEPAPPADRLKVLLVGGPAGWELPGSLVRIDESFEMAARRALVRKSGYDPADWYLDQLATFGAVDRDTRGRVVSVGHLALARVEDLRVVDPAVAANAAWHPVSTIPWDRLHWDHPAILKTALGRLRSKLRYSWVAFELLPAIFAISDLRDLYAALYGERVARLSTTNFLKGFRPLLESGELVAVGEVERRARRGRPPSRYRFVGSTTGTRDRELPW